MLIHTYARLTCSVAILTLATACASGEHVWRRAQTEDQHNTVSLVELIANPDKYDGWKVDVTGYLHCVFEGELLFLSSHDLRDYTTENAVGIACRYNTIGFSDPDARQWHGHRVTIGGTFHGRPRKQLMEGEIHLGSWVTGTIDPIDYIFIYE